jgi:two-component system sensor histidine kinase RegB
MDYYRQSLSQLFWLRNIAILGQFTAILVSQYWLHLPFETTHLIFVTSSLIVLNMVTWIRMRSPRIVGEIEYFSQMLYDVFALFLLLYFSGGANNPFTSLFILQVMIAATTLSSFYTWITSSVVIALYLVLMKFAPEIPHLHHHFIDLHISGMLVTFIILTLIISYFIVKMGTTSRNQQVQLKESEQLAILGIFATNAAHDLGTPLSTISFIANDLQKKLGPDYQEVLATLREEVKECKKIISDITLSAGVLKSDSGRFVFLNEYIQDILTHFKEKYQPQNFTVTLSNDEGVKVFSDSGLRMAIQNILTNGHQASPQELRFTMNLENDFLFFYIEDFGPGFSSELLENFGKIGLTTKPQGMGLGLFLSKTACSRLGGELLIKNKKDSGAIVAIKIPIKSLQ